LLWPGGPPPAVGHGGIGFLTLTTIGVGVGAGVGRAVGLAVGSGVGVGGVGGVAVGREVGRGVGVERGVVVGAGVLTTGVVAGVGVGPWAMVGALSVGLADGSLDGVGLADAGGVDSDAPGVVGDALEPDVDGLAPGGSVELPGATALGCEDAPTAIPPFGCAGAIRPAVSATVARTRLRSPIATTRRARWAEVTTTDGLLPTGPLAEVPPGPADGSTGTPGPAYGRRQDGPDAASAATRMELSRGRPPPVPRTGRDRTR
jgi:hypothetical protein